MSSDQAHFGIVDFHCHHVPARFDLTAARTAPANQRARWEAIARKLSDEDLLLRDIREANLAARVVNLAQSSFAHLLASWKDTLHRR